MKVRCIDTNRCVNLTKGKVYEVLEEITRLGFTLYTISNDVEEIHNYNSAFFGIVDNVNHPSHYTNGKYECIDVLEDITKDLKGIEAICTANAIKYLWRWKYKNGVEDLKKARWYLDKLIKELEEEK